ncbi:MAG: phosphoribosylanthranilate isomerase [Thermomicrobiales bacterium]|nr:phosphoribosylanthranilate isomerase [Thermomicrobiales bacterium]
MLDRLSEYKRRGGIVKIDGLMSAAHAVIAAEAGADLVGIIFAPSRRRVAPVAAKIMVDLLRKELGARTPPVVGVFVDESVENVNAVVEEVGLDVVQLNGSDSAEVLGLFSCPVIRAVGPPPGSVATEVQRQIDVLRLDEKRPALWVVDAWDPVNRGGSGKRADWSMAAELAATTPFLLAGGLDPESVADAIRVVRPLGVDVSSGVETDGMKDFSKIEAFVHAAKAAFAQQRPRVPTP